MSKGDTYAEAGKTAVLQHIHGTMEFLRKYAPFIQMEPAHLAFLVENCELRFYAEGDSIISPDDGTVQHFYIVKQGRVHGQRPHTSKRGTDTTFEVIVGECFPMAALMGERATRTGHFAAEDTFCLLLNKPAFVKLVSKSEVFRDFAVRGVSSLLDLVNQQAQTRAVENLGERYSLETTVGELAVHHPISCQPTMPLRQAVSMMQEANVGSIVIVDEAQHPLGIFTLRDLRRVIGTQTDNLGSPISAFMTHEPFHLPPGATAFDAAIAMTERHIGHVCVVKNGLLCGVISERDLFSLQRVDLVHLAQTIRHADRVESLVAIRTRINQLVDNMLAHGASSTQITRIITLLNDHTVRRVIEMAIADQGNPGVPFTWLCFGSEGRREQTLYTDQDNGILFEASDASDAALIRGKLLPLAERINRDLDICGFTLCKGNIMASNPELCRSEHEWQQLFSRIIHSPDPNNILKASIYFDVRGVWGNCEGLARLLPTMLRTIHDLPPFERLMATNVLSYRLPFTNPLALLGSWLGLHQTTVDLKAQALTPFVDAARILALSHNIEAASTLERLRLLHEKKLWSDADYEALQHAYSYIQRLRLSLHSEQFQAGQPLSNQLDLVSLNPLERRILRASVRQVYRLLQSVRFKYQL